MAADTPLDEYPSLVVRIYTESYEEDGAVYTLGFPDGTTRKIGEVHDDYHILADIIDRAWEGTTS